MFNFKKILLPLIILFFQFVSTIHAMPRNCKKTCEIVAKQPNPSNSNKVTIVQEIYEKCLKDYCKMIINPDNSNKIETVVNVPN